MRKGIETSVKWNGNKVQIQAKKATEKSVFALGKVILEKARELAPKLYGPLAASINMQSSTGSIDIGDEAEFGIEEPPSNRRQYRYSNLKKPTAKNTVVIGTNIPYAMDVEFGTGAHTISVRRAKVLSDTYDIFGRTVQHPGQAAEPYMRPAFDDGMSRGLLKFAEMWQNSVEFAKIAKYIDI